MIVESLKLENFRIFVQKKLQFSNLNVIIGPNATGKTNILDACWMLAFGRSFQASEEIELVNFGKNHTSIYAQVQDNDESFELKINLLIDEATNPVKKKFMLDNTTKRLVDFAGRLKVVLFAPSDLELVYKSPSIRREYLDGVLLQTDRNYHRVVQQYERLLRSRNKLLEKIALKNADKKELAFWDENLTKLGIFISQKREEFILYCNNLEKIIGDFEWQYQSNPISLERLLASLEHDLRILTTSVGPHRDDFIFYQGKTNLSKFGSRGEDRMAVLALKLAELAFIKEKSAKNPILLLDDIFSELDDVHRREIEKIVNSQQTIITTTDADLIPKKFLKEAKIIKLEK